MKAGLEVNELQTAAFLSACLDISCGTLWRDREDAWQETPHEYVANSAEQGRLRLSLRKSPPVGLYEIIPLLHGTTKAGHVMVVGLTVHEPEKKVHFGHLLFPSQISVVDVDSNADDTELDGPRYCRGCLSPNWNKLKITPEESNELADWLREISIGWKNSFKDSGISRSGQPGTF